MKKKKVFYVYKEHETLSGHIYSSMKVSLFYIERVIEHCATIEHWTMLIFYNHDDINS